MLSADRLHEFMAILDQGSISAAARALGLPRATVSRRLATIEEALGVRLLHRGTRRLVPTEAGHELYRRACRVVQDTEAAWSAVRRLDDIPRGPLRVSVADTRTASADLFVAFAMEFPEVRLEVTTTPRHIDLVAEGIDVAVRFGELDDRNLIARRLWTHHVVAVASPAYLARRGEPVDAASLADHDCIAGFAGESTPARTWPCPDGTSVPITPRFASTDLDLRMAAARRGLGIAVLPAAIVRSDLEQGTLRRVLEGIVGARSLASLVYVDREFMPPQVRSFIEYATRFYREWLPG